MRGDAQNWHSKKMLGSRTSAWNYWYRWFILIYPTVGSTKVHLPRPLHQEEKDTLEADKNVIREILGAIYDEERSIPFHRKLSWKIYTARKLVKGTIYHETPGIGLSLCTPPFEMFHKKDTTWTPPRDCIWTALLISNDHSFLRHLSANHLATSGDFSQTGQTFHVPLRCSMDQGARRPKSWQKRRWCESSATPAGFKATKTRIAF